MLDCILKTRYVYIMKQKPILLLNDFLHGKKPTTVNNQIDSFVHYCQWYKGKQNKTIRKSCTTTVKRNNSETITVPVHAERLIKMIMSTDYPTLMLYIRKCETFVATSTLRQHLKQLSSFAEYLIDVGVLTKNIFPAGVRRLPRSKVKANPTKYIDTSEVIRLLENETDLKWKAAMSLLFYTGMRRSELLKIDVSDVASDCSFIILRDTKNGTDRKQPVPEVVRPILRQHLASLNFMVPQVFRGNNAERMSKSMLYRYFKKHFGVGTHSARATVVTNLLRMGCDKKAIAEVVGHSSIHQIDTYDRQPSRAHITAELITYH